ncbi:MAG: carboxypeptidase-like regulatory domain-containing protein [Acidobacteriota bacterium]|nr:carboxypeptidase-like regulatory domain-containing protein [Acidobacteriota bacterium]
MRIRPGSKLAAALCGWLLLAGGAALAQHQNDAPHALVAGAVFRENGFSLPGAAVTLALKDAPKGKKLQALSDARGEFAFRVMPGAATYVVRGTRKGFQATEKEVAVGGEERVDVTLVLPAESK